MQSKKADRRPVSLHVAVVELHFPDAEGHDQLNYLLVRRPATGLLAGTPSRSGMSAAGLHSSIDCMINASRSECRAGSLARVYENLHAVPWVFRVALATCSVLDHPWIKGRVPDDMQSL